MANKGHLKILKQGVEAWNQWRRENPEIRPDLSDANLSGAKLSGADLRFANLTGANLNYAKLSGANLSYASFLAVLLIDADLSGADLSRAKLQDTNLAEAEIMQTIFTHNDLSSTKGLETVKHQGPASIGADTLVKSKGRIPEAFLRGCGLSDWEIESAKLYNPDLSNEEITDINYRIHDLRVSRAFQINPLFISYSHSNGAFVDNLEKHLTAQGIRFWRDIHHAKAGRLEKQIDAAIHLNDVVLLVLSEHSTSSDWVEHEARRRERKKSRPAKTRSAPSP